MLVRNPSIKNLIVAMLLVNKLHTEFIFQGDSGSVIGGRVFSDVSAAEECIDTRENCEKWRDRGYCEHDDFRKFMSRCRKSCGLCGGDYCHLQVYFFLVAMNRSMVISKT